MRVKSDQLTFEFQGRHILRPWWRNKYTWISGIFSLLWMVFIGHYLSVSGWWQNRYDLAPAEFIGGVCGLALPMVIVWLVCAYFDRTDRLETEAEVLRSYLNELVYPTEEGAVYTKALTDALRTQITEFRTVFQAVNDQTQAVRDDLKKWVRDLSAVIKHVDTKTIDSVREIADHIQKLAQMTDAANTQADRTSALFSEQAAILERVCTQTIQETGRLTQSLGGQATDLRALLGEIGHINQQSEQAVTKADQVMTALNQNGARIEEAVNLYETSARQQNARLFGNLEKVLSVFRAHGDLLEQEVGRTANRMAVVEAGLKEQAESVVQATAAAVQNMQQATQTFAQTKGDVQGALETFRSTAEKVAGQIEKAGQTVRTVPIVRQVQTDDLLQEAGIILTRLQELSVDMAHLFSPKAEENLWERYYSGDKTVFMRHIKTEINDSKYKKIKELYQSDTAFRRSVDEYMRAFESMTQVLDKEDENKLLMSIVIGSDVGRLYMVLAQVVKGKSV